MTTKNQITSFQGESKHMRVRKVFSYLTLSFILLACLAVQAQDVEGSEDHPLLTRFPGSSIRHYKDEVYAEVKIPLDRGQVKRNFLEVAGRVRTIFYKAPGEWTALQVFRNYEKAIQDKKFEILYSMTDRRASKWYSTDTYNFHNDKFEDRQGDSIRAFGISPKDLYYLAARSPQGAVIALMVGQRQESRRGSEYDNIPLVHLEIIEPEQVETGLVTATAQEHAQNIVAKGSTSLPSDVLFDVDKAVLKPEANQALAEAARFMTENSQLRLLIVGHTDITGSLSHNADLSLRRAQAVRQALVGRYGISASRLESHGAGALAPVATNSSEEGRQLNRRVEFVER